MATRAQINEARSKGGKPSDANRVRGRTAAQDVYENDAPSSARASDGSTVERGEDGVVYRYNPKYDYTTIERPDGTSSAPMRGNQLPGGMNKYIDKVLDMSGMNSGGGGAPSNVPTPTPRPNDSGMSGTENNPGKLADDQIAQAPAPEDAVANSNAATFGEAVAGLLAGGAAGGLAKYAYDKVKGARNPIDSTIDMIDGAADAPLSDDEYHPHMQGDTPAIAAEERRALPAPQGKLPAPTSAIDQSIDAVDGPPDQTALPAPPKQITDADAPYTPRNPERPVDPGVAASTQSAAPSRAEIFQRIAGMKPREALAMMQQYGISLNDLGPDEIRALAAASNSMKAGRQAAASAVESAVRGAAR